MSEILTAISTVGYPIVSAICVGLFCKYLIDKYTTIMTDTLDELRNAITELREELKSRDK